MKNFKKQKVSTTSQEGKATQGRGKFISPKSRKEIIKMLAQGVSKKNEKFKGVKITLAGLKAPLF